MTQAVIFNIWPRRGQFLSIYVKMIGTTPSGLLSSENTIWLTLFRREVLPSLLPQRLSSSTSLGFLGPTQPASAGRSHVACLRIFWAPASFFFSGHPRPRPLVQSQKGALADLTVLVGELDWAASRWADLSLEGNPSARHATRRP
jgi:hypothetical protein